MNNYSTSFDFVGLALFLGALVVIGILATLPYRYLGMAFRNCSRLDGTFSRKRARVEFSHLMSFFAELLVIPLMVVGFTVGGLLIVHKTVIPIPLVVDIAEMFSINPETFEQRTESGDLGDVGLIYEEWTQEQGYSARRNVAVRKFLKDHWLTLSVILFAILVIYYWFMTQYYVISATKYADALVTRSRRYRERDQHNGMIAAH